MDTALQPRCPICGGARFEDLNTRKNTRCVKCKSLPRHRVAWMFLRDHVKPQADWRVLHMAPDPQIAPLFIKVCNEGYDPVDLDPARYEGKLKRPVRQLDLVKDELPVEHYDLVLHSHVMEHIPSNVTLLLQRLHRAIKPGGVHLFALPVWPGYSREDFNPAMPEKERLKVFGHTHHVRRFGQDDFDVTIGPVFGLTSAYTLTDYFDPDVLRQSNVGEEVWRCSGSSVFMVRK